MSDQDFPAWAWAWIVAGIVAAGLLVAAFYVDDWRRGDARAERPGALRVRLHGRAMLWWALGVMTFVLAEVFESDPLTWAAFGAFLVGYITLAVRDAYGRAAQHAKAWSAFGLGAVLAYGALLAHRRDHEVWMWLLSIAAGALVLLACRIARASISARP